MQAAPIPENEATRIASLRDLLILDTPPEERFDHITAFCSTAFHVPIALVSLVDVNRQWFKSCYGLDVGETSRDISFCGHAIHSDKPLVIEDATKDPRFADNPLVTGGPGIRFYAGQPLTLSDGQRVGTLCLIDRRPRRLDTDDLKMLSDLGRLVVRELEDRARILHDA